MKYKRDSSQKELLKRLPVKKYANYIDVPVYRSVNYFFETTEQVVDYHKGIAQRARYGRYDNLTWEHAESLIAALEQSERALLFPSGMSALATTIFSLCDTGNHIIYNSNSYRTIGVFCKEMLPRFGLQSSGISGLSDSFIDEVTATIKSNTRAIIIEAPSNPHTQLVDLLKLKRALSGRPDIVVIVDSTFASPYNWKPALFGADIVIQSCTKYLAGTSNIVAGSAAGPGKLISVIQKHRNILGNIISPDDAYWLSHGIYTLKPRMEYYNSAGLTVAKYLEKHPKIRRVYYTGLKSHPQFQLARKILKGSGGVVSFEIDSNSKAVSKFIENVKIPFMATHFGGPFTVIEQYGIFTMFHLSRQQKQSIGINDQLVRLSLGFEDLDMILEDIGKNLARV